MSLGGVGPIGGEGSRGMVGINATQVADDAPDPTKYHKTAKGTIIPHRLSDDGSSPAFDPKKGLSQFDIVDVDTTPGGGQVVHAAGTLDAHGQPAKPEETPCPTPTTPASGSPSEAPTTPQAQLSLPKATRRRTRTSEPDLPMSEVAELLKQLESRLSTQSSLLELCQQLQSRLSSVEDRLVSLTSALAPTPTASPQPTSFHLPTNHWRVVLDGPFGRMVGEALAVDLRSETTVCLLYDPEKPHFIPAKSDQPITLTCQREGYDFDLQVLPNGWSSPLMIGDRDLVLVVMGVVPS